MISPSSRRLPARASASCGCLRTLRLLHTYQLLYRLRQDFSYFRRHEDVILATVNLVVFLFVMTGLIYATQHGANPQIVNYADALYFTVTTLTTTGFGDITLQGTGGADAGGGGDDRRHHPVSAAGHRAVPADAR